ncbi:prepilin-type cleavage/methylation domain-containing protein [Campylobacter blaseri]|uniref:Prepilin-type cleavage/methylation domain-containing protein n=2 Tax=Campylobacter blaseri TaxID=2042961 RepID=A0A2P8R044_9BACT|nr:prepilin-type N-terminal cleavage/methylation domain-containing protein [Campylobacter blaseri]PSM51867.1 prepilin-type cleavage/methylation domain-containing protein [Campylobacter blaseri]PSM53658.1 prepilin-type cleavage/methylation domain-containing protein [Campylobacter blaseri]
MKYGFTMMELVFVIVILGILSAVAIPRLAVSRDDATVAKIRADLSAIRSGISLKKSENLMSGNVATPKLGDFFENVLSKPLSKGDSRNGWTKNSDNSYTACVAGQCATFTYYETKQTIKVGTKDQNVSAGTLLCQGKNCHLFE